MESYDPNKRYLGPQGHWLNKYIPEHPSCAPDKLKDLINRAAYDHDCDFEGDDYAGWWGAFKKWLNKEAVIMEISLANLNFRDKIISAIEKTKHVLNDMEIAECYLFAEVVYQAVNNFGWAFYKTGNSNA